MNKNYAVAGAILLSLNVYAQEKTKVDSLNNYYEIQEVNILGKEKNEGPIHKIDAQLIKDFNKTNVVDAVNLLSGVSITQIGARNEGSIVAEKTFLNFTGYYYTYYNKMKQYDDDQYSLLNKNLSFSSVYDDYSLGGILNLTTEAIKNNVITLSVNDKFDSHTEYNEEILANKSTGQKFKTGEPEQNYRDNTFYVGLEDVVTINSFIKTVVGASYNSRNNIKAQEYGTHYESGEKNILYDFPKGSDNTFDYKCGLL